MHISTSTSDCDRSLHPARAACRMRRGWRLQRPAWSDAASRRRRRPVRRGGRQLCADVVDEQIEIAVFLPTTRASISRSPVRWRQKSPLRRGPSIRASAALAAGDPARCQTAAAGLICSASAGRTASAIARARTAGRLDGPDSSRTAPSCCSRSNRRARQNATVFRVSDPEDGIFIQEHKITSLAPFGAQFWHDRK